MNRCSASPDFEEITARGRVVANYDHKGHRFAEVEVLVIANGTTAVAHIAHTAIYRPRQVAAA